MSAHLRRIPIQIHMATIKYYDLIGSTTASSLIGESGYLPLSSLVPNYSSYTISQTDDGVKLSEKFYSGTNLTYTFEYSYSKVTSPAPDKKISLINQYNSAGDLLASWSGLELSLKDLQQKDAAPLFQGEDSIEGNASNNYLQGALGDDVLTGLSGNDTLDGGRADDTLIGGAGADSLYGGLGTDYAAFSGSSENYRWISNADGSINITDTTFVDGVDRLYDVEWLLFDYGKATQSQILVSKLKYSTSKYSLITGYAQTNPADLVKYPYESNIIVEGNYWTFKSNAHILSWALADNGNYKWPNKDGIQDIIGGALEEFSKVADINFQYIGAYSTVANATNGGADFVYTLNDLGTSGTIAQAFFPNDADRTIDFNFRQINPAYGGNSFVEFLSFVTIHETGHTLGLKHPHDASSLNPAKVFPVAANRDDGLSTLFTVMSYYNPSGILSASSYYATTPMYLDALALGAIYGAPTYRDAIGDTDYSIVSAKNYQTIVDNSGKNTLDARAASEGWFIALNDTGTKLAMAFAYGGKDPNTQVFLAAGNFSNARGSSYYDSIFGTINDNNINSGDGNDFVWSYGGGDTLDGGNGLDTLVFTENISDFSIASAVSGAITFTKNSVFYATATSFESFRFGYGTSLNKDFTLAQLNTYIVDTSAQITTTITGTAKEDEKLGAKVVISDADGVGNYTMQWQGKSAVSAWADLPGQSESYLSLAQAHVDQTIRVKINYIDKLGHAQTAYSTATTAVLNINDLPTGPVSISGQTVSGQILTADTSLIKDQDGLGVFNYQWQRTTDGSKWITVDGATAKTYTISDADAFTSMRVVASYQDGYLTQESVTSAATGLVDPTNFTPTGSPVIQYQGTVAAENSSLSVDMSGVADKDGLGTFAYQWQKFSNSTWVTVQDAKLKAFNPTDSEVGLSLRLKASFVDGRGNLETVYSEATAAVQNVNDAPTGSIRIEGSHIEDSILSVGSNLSDDDGLGALSYQWQYSSNKTNWTNITGANTATLKLTDAQVGTYVRVASTYLDGHGTSESSTSEATTLIRNINDDPSGAVLITGTVNEDQTLTANASSVVDEDGLGTVTLQWQYESVVGAWVDIAGATSNTLTLGDAQVGKSIRATAQFTDLRGTNEIVASYGTVGTVNVNDAPTGSVLIDGILALGSTLSANTSGVSDADGILVITDGIYEIDSFTYQWQTSANGTVWIDIANATDATYVLVSADMGHKIRVQAAYTDLHGTTEQTTSTATTFVPTTNSSPAGTITVSGTATEDMTLQVSTAGLSDPDGLGAFRFQWQRSWDGADWSNVKNATAVSYALNDDDVAYVVRAAVTYTDNHGTQELVYSSASVQVTGVNDAPMGRVKVTGQFFQGGVVSADTSNLQDNDGLGELQYQWQRSVDGTTYKNISAATEKNYELTTLEVDFKVRVIVSYKDGQGFRESISSAASQKILDVNDAPLGIATLSGDATEDQVISSNTTALKDADGLGAFQYAWQVSQDGDVWGDRTNAFNSTLQLDDQDVGMYVRSVVTYVDGHGNFETVYSQPSGPVIAINDAPLGDLSLIGLLSSGQTLTVDSTDIRDPDGAGIPSFDWYRANTATGTWTKISTTTSPGYTLTNDDISQYLRVDLTYTDKQGFTETVTSRTDRTILGGVEGRTAGVLISGSIKDDMITAATADSNISAGAGNDQVTSGVGADVIDAGTGNDAIYLESDGVWAGGFQAARYEFNAQGTGRIVEYVLIDGRNRFFDVIDGNTGFDTIVLAETFNGDAFFLHDFFSDFNASETTAFVVDSKGDSGTSRLSGVERILGGQGDDIIDVTSPTFTLGNLEIQGNQGADVLWGGDGDDTLDGGAGTDSMAGGLGQDQFVLRLGESNSTVALADHIRDFKIGSDKFALSGGLAYSDLLIQSITDTDGATKLAITNTSGTEIYALLDNFSSDDLSTLTSSDFVIYAKDEKITLTGIATEDQTLSLDISNVKNKAADAPLTVKWQVLAEVNVWETFAEGLATTITLGQTQVGHAVRAVASYSDIYGFERSYATEPTSSVLNINDLALGAPIILGAVTTGQTLHVDVGNISDADGLGDLNFVWQTSINGSTWAALSNSTSSELGIDATLVGKSIRSVVSYTDGGGTAETLTSSATDVIFGYTGQAVVFAKVDDPAVNNIKVTQDLKRANSFAFDFDFTYTPTQVVSTFTGKDKLAVISLLPTQPLGGPLTITLGSSVIDVAYGQWIASAGSSLVGDVSSQDRYTLAVGTYKVHIELKSVNSYQDFIAVVSKYETDGSVTDIGITSVSLDVPAFNDSRDFDLYVDGSANAGVSELDNFKVGLTRIPKLFEEFTGTPDADIMYGTSMSDVMYGFEGGDTIYGLEGNDTIYGGDGNNFLSGGANDDSLLGGAGNDTIIGDSGNDLVDGGQGSDYLLGANGDDVITIGGNNGAAFSTYADGGAGTNTLTINYAGVTKLSDFVSRAFINAGSQTLDGSFSLVDANGGTIDFKNFGYDSSNARYALTVGPTLYYFNPIGGVFGDTLASSHASSLGVSGNKGAAYSSSGGEVALFTTTLASTSAFDGTYTSQMGSPSVLQISGSTGRDLIKGGAGADTIHGNGGNDEIYAVGIGNSVYGDAGNDVVFLAATSELSSNTVLDGGVGLDTLNFTTVSLGTSNTTGGLTVNMGAIGVAINFENLVGDFFNDTLTGDSNNNVIIGVLGNDTLSGAGGNDTLYGDWGATLSDSALYGLSQGGSYSNDGSDVLYGGAGNDVLMGNGGADRLDGGTGADTLTGGPGSDTYVLRTGDGGSTIATGDVITDFQDGADLILLINGMTYGQLNISAGIESHLNNSIVKFSDEFLVELIGIAPTQLSAIDFTS